MVVNENVLDSVAPEHDVSQRGCGCPIPGSVPGQVRWGFEQPDLAEDIPTCVRDVMIFKSPFQLKPCYDSIILGGG